jgi:hypothetical protein
MGAQREAPYEASYAGVASFEKLFTVIVVGDELVYREWVKKTNAYRLASSSDALFGCWIRP